MMKKISVLALVLLLTTSLLAACASSNESSEGGAGSGGEGEIYIPIISKGFQHQSGKL
ncbi:hypothetical protein JCM10914_1138 [Paenibacillus sp. JCM 10914]|nr:hypothetical protein JCM10914_1138 [Paenibacillus sp. JCM 10914]